MVNTDFTIDKIRASIVNYLYNEATTFKVGTGDSDADSSDTSLDNPVFENPIDTKQKTENTVVYRCHIETSEANGYTLKEFGIFDGSSNMMLRRKISSQEKTDAMDLWIQIVEEVII